MTNTKLNTLNHYIVTSSEKQEIRNLSDIELAAHYVKIEGQWKCSRTPLQKQKLWNIMSEISMERIKREYGE